MCVFLALTGCAAGNLEPTTAATLAYAPAGEAGGNGGGQVITAGYQLSPEEQEYDCKRLAGHLQIRILELRSRLSDTQTSQLSRSLNTVGSATMGGSSFGLDPKSDRARDVAQIRAYNDELVTKHCRSFDLAKAITGDDMPPSPTVPPASSSH
ncbi:MAG: hypothetical protein R3D51_09680 [Hyphomicrobiaceae bacterium]